jgi:hypothetical protein
VIELNGNLNVKRRRELMGRHLTPITPGTTTWLVQRFEKPTGHINPFGDVNAEVGHKDTQEKLMNIVSPAYMGAFEYECGSYSECLAAMYEAESLELVTIDIFPRIIHLITSDIDRDVEEIHKLYVDSDAGKEVSKNDSGSFRRVMCNEDDRTVGWMSLKGHYAWFIDKSVAREFFSLLVPVIGWVDPVEDDQKN